MGVQERGGLLGRPGRGLGEESGQNGRQDARGGLRTPDQDLPVRVPDRQDAILAADHLPIEPDAPASLPGAVPEPQGFAHGQDGLGDAPVACAINARRRAASFNAPSKFPPVCRRTTAAMPHRFSAITN